MKKLKEKKKLYSLTNSSPHASQKEMRNGNKKEINRNGLLSFFLFLLKRKIK